MQPQQETRGGQLIPIAIPPMTMSIEAATAYYIGLEHSKAHLNACPILWGEIQIAQKQMQIVVISSSHCCPSSAFAFFPATHFVVLVTATAIAAPTTIRRALIVVFYTISYTKHDNCANIKCDGRGLKQLGPEGNLLFLRNVTFTTMGVYYSI